MNGRDGESTTNGPDMGWYGDLQGVLATLRDRFRRARPERDTPAAVHEIGTRKRHKRKRSGRGHGTDLKEREKQEFGKWFVATYAGMCQRLLGERLAERPDRHLEERLRQADMPYPGSLFRAMQYLTTLLVFVAGLGVMLVVSVAMRLPFALVWGLGVAGLGAGMTFGAFPTVVGNKITNRKRAIERDLAFSLSELSVLASIGLSPIELCRRMAARDHDPAMTDVFRAVVHRTDIQGKDLITALAETAKEAPSEALRETLWDLGNMMHQGGDLGTYLQHQAGEVLDLKRATQKSFIEQLTTYADAYVTVVLIGVIFLAIGAFLIDAFGRTAGGLSASALLVLLTYGIVPLIVVLVGILLASAYSAHE